MRIVYTSFRGLFSDSPRAIYEALAARGDDVTHTWLTAPVAEGAFPAGVGTVPFGSPESIAALEAADVVVSNDHVPLDWEKRPDAFYLQTWHGTPLKRIHNDVFWAPEGRLAYLEHDIARWDAMLSPNAYSTARFRQAFGFRGPVHETGYPRNDLLSSPRRDEVRAAVRSALGIGADTRVVLYTPTWRDDLVFEGKGERDFDFPVDLGDFTKRLGEDHVLLLRLHNMVSSRLEAIEGLPVRDVSSYPDIRDLYLAADVLVTDYSSTMFDFAITGRPVLLFPYDLAEYRDRLRGFYVDLEEIAPGPLLSSSAELVKAIADLDAVAAAHADRYRSFRETYTSLEDGHATERVLDLFFPPGGTSAGAAPTTRGGDDSAHR
ncbi:CDP-glycerol glycerophosphotransferase family protein [Geodermatophilus sp. SYSU D00710]